MFVNHQSNAKSWRVACVDMMKIVEKVVIAADLGKLKFHFILVIHSKRQFAKNFNARFF